MLPHGVVEGEVAGELWTRNPGDSFGATLEDDERISFGWGGWLEAGATRYESKLFAGQLQARVLRETGPWPALALGVQNLTNHKDADPRGVGLLGGTTRTESFSAFAVCERRWKLSRDLETTGVLGFGIGRFRADPVADSLGAKTKGLFGGFSAGTKNLQLLAEFDGRDANVGLRYRDPVEEVFLTLSGIQRPRDGGPRPQDAMRIGFGVAFRVQLLAPLPGTAPLALDPVVVAPGKLDATVRGGNVRLKWNPSPGMEPTGYNLFVHVPPTGRARRLTHAKLLHGDHVTLTGAFAGTQLKFEMNAEDEYEKESDPGPSVIVSVGAPAAPAAISAAMRGNDSVAIHWKQGPGGPVPSGYLLYVRRADVAHFAKLTRSPLNALGVVIAGAPSGMEFVFRVTGIGYDGVEGPPSSQTALKIPPPKGSRPAATGSRTTIPVRPAATPRPRK